MISVSMFTTDTDLLCFVSVNFLIRFWYQGYSCLIKQVDKYSYLSHIRKSSCKTDAISSSNVKSSLVKHLHQKSSLWKDFKFQI